jgi:hypothetical protein
MKMTMTTANYTKLDGLTKIVLLKRTEEKAIDDSSQGSKRRCEYLFKDYQRKRMSRRGGLRFKSFIPR